jgi:ATP-dependent helicase/nuclease subunit B
MGTRARPEPTLGVLHVVAWGAPALDQLDAMIAAAQRHDPLAPVTVVVSSSHAGATVRRRLAAAEGRSGLINVAFVSFPQVAERLAAPFLAAERRPPLAPIVALAATRAALRDHPEWFRGAAASPSALQSLTQTLAELSDLEPVALDRLAAADPRAHDVVGLFRDVRRRCAGHADDHDVVAAAVRAVAQGVPAVVEVGQVIVYLPRRVRPLDIELASALAGIGALSVVCGPSVDGGDAIDGVRAAFAPLLPAVEVAPGSPSGSTAVHLARAPDPHDEVRSAVRAVLDAAQRGVAVDRIAVVARLSDPYFALLHEELTAAGVPHHGPTGLRLAQSVAGRVLLGVLDLFDRDLPRTDLFQWLRSAPLRGPEGERLKVDRLDRVARESGVAGGFEVWAERLDVEEHDLEALQAEPPSDPPARHDWVHRRLDDVRSLQTLVDWLRTNADDLANCAGWADRAAWAEQFLVDALGPPERIAGDSEGDEAAYLRVLQILASVGALDAVDGHNDTVGFRSVLSLALDAPGPTAGRFGHGVFVGSLADAAGAHHDLLLVVGMAEGIYPPRGQDDPVLPDAVRATLGSIVLAPRRPARADERRDHIAALAGSAAAHLSFPRADTRAQRERYPSRWFLDEVRQQWARPGDQPVGVDELDALAGAGLSWWSDVASFVASVEAAAASETTTTLVTVAERTAAAMLAARRLGSADTPRVEVPDDRPALVRGAVAILERQAGRFGPYTGRVGDDPALRFAEQRVGSATALETWATCPFRYFLHQVLHVRPLDERAEADEINPLDRGSYVHEVLEKLVSDDLSSDAVVGDAPLGSADLDRLRQIAAEVGESYRADGLTGRPLLWKLRSRQLLRLLEQILWVDRSHRLDRSVRPVAVELAFGSRDEAGEWTGVPPVVIDLSGERNVAFRGFVDRVDRSSDGDRLVVIDYKTGKRDKYGDVQPPKGAGDIVSRGQHLQLALYALAAESQFDDPTTVSAFFWFVEETANPFVGGEIDDWAKQRLVDVLEIVVGGIEHGWFPARPGEDGFFGFENCGFCDFNRVCPSSRAEQWERVRLAPELGDYRELSEGPLVTPDAAPAADGIAP